MSGTAILDALVGSGYPVEAWLVDLDGGWWRLPDGHRRDGRPQAAYDDPAALGAEGPVGAAAALDRLAAAAHRPVVFIALHGPFGEDGTVQALCEAAGLAYTGSGVAASAIGMDKAVFKRLIRGLGLPVVDWREVRLARWTRDRDGVLAELEAFAAGTGDERLMVKPARLGSSVGMTLAHAAGERAGALDTAFRYDDLALVERYLAGSRDLEVAVIGNEPNAIELYGPGEIVAGHEFYDYAAKYTRRAVRDHDRRGGDARPEGAHPQARPGRLPRDGLRRVRARGLPAGGHRARRLGDQHDPGLHADQPVPDAPAPRPATTSPRSAAGSWTSRSSARPAASGTG